MASLLPRAIIFDWDNTLVDSWPAIAPSINYVRAKYGLEVWTYEQVIERCTRSARESFPDWFGDKWQAAWEDYYKYFDETRARLGLTPLNGAVDLLDWLQTNHIAALVVSNKSDDYLQREAVELGWNRYFKSIVGAHRAEKDKPARDHADYALKLADIKAGPDIWFVGDSEADMTCARNASCFPVLIGNALSATRLKIDTYVPDCAALLQLLINSHRSIA